MQKDLEDREDARFGEEGGQMALQSAILHWAPCPRSLSLS